MESAPQLFRASRPGPTFAWWVVLCLVGLDYFSTLAYLPSVAIASTGALAPIAAAGVVFVTLLAALPVYFYVVGRSPHGHGGVGLLEANVHGWGGKLLILLVLGFIATDFVLTRSLSTADAAAHLTGNPYWRQHTTWFTQNRDLVRSWLPLWLQGRVFEFVNEQLLVTLLLSVLSFALYFFLVQGLTRGFLRLAVFVVGLYLFLTAIVVGTGLVHLAENPDLLTAWEGGLRNEWKVSLAVSGGVLGDLAFLALLAFPPMALGLSGFELSVATAKFIDGSPADTPTAPRGRIFRARILLLVAALVMSVFVLGVVFVVTTLVPRTVILPGEGVIQHRSLAYLAHGGELSDATPGVSVNPLAGAWFGTLYDLSTVLILALAGASATIGLKDLVPDYLARFGMQLVWAHKVGVILHLFNGVILLVTVAFRASVTAQQGAYATSVLALLLAASLASYLDVRHRVSGAGTRLVASFPFLLATFLFAVMGVLTLWHNAAGVGIALIFVAVVIGTSAVSRWIRCTELRFQGFEFADETSRGRWDEIRRVEFQVLVPHRPGRQSRAAKGLEIRQVHRLGSEVPILFVEVEMGDPSDFAQSPVLKIVKDSEADVLLVSRCTSVAHVLAVIALAFREVGQPPEVHFGWSDESPNMANLNFLLLGQGNVPWIVRELLRHAEPDPSRRPRVVVG